MPIFLSIHLKYDIASDVRHLVDQHFEQYKDDISPQHASTFTCVLTPADSFQDILTLHEELVASDHPATMAFHVGKANRLGETYAGPSVEHARCLAEAGWPEQILLSQTLIDTNYLPPDTEVEDLGRHRLKDLTPSEHVYQLAHPRLSKHNFPPLRTLDSVPHNLRPQSRPFIGRHAERGVLTDMLQMAEQRLITLRGPGGIGKTRLALQIAAETAISYPDGVYYLSLESAGTPDRLMSIMIDGLGIPVRGSRSTHDQLLAHLRNKQMLLILDNFEHLLPPPELITEILDATHRVSLLVTSRVALDIPGEREYTVAGLSYPPEKNGHEAGVYDAVELFAQAAQLADPLFTVSNKNRVSVHRICRQLAGMPLGIELAATWVRVFSPMEIASQLVEDMEALATNRRDIQERHRSLRLVFDHSWRLLTKEEQDAFLHLTVFQGGFQEEAALEVAGASREVLDSLCAKSLLSRSSDRRFRILQPLSQFAANDLSLRTNVWQRLKDRHARYYTDLMADHTVESWSDLLRTILSGLVSEIENIKAAWRWAAQRGYTAALDESIEFMYRFHRMRGYYQEGENLFRFAKENLERATSDHMTPDTRGTLAKLQECVAMFALHLSKLDTAQREMEESLVAFQELGLRRYEGFSNIGLGLIAYEYGQLSKAEAYFRRSYEILDNFDDKYASARAIHQLGKVNYAAGRYQQALEDYHRSLEIHETFGDQLGIANCLYSIGCVKFIMADFTDAKKSLVQSRNIYQDLGDRRGLSATQLEMGLIASVEGRFWDALSYFEEALAMRRELGDPALIAEATVNLAGICYTLGQFERVESYINTLTELRSEYQQPAISGFTFLLRGVFELAESNPKAGADYLQEAVDIMAAIGYQNERMLAEGYLIFALILLGQLDQAEDLCNESLDHIQSTGARQFRVYRLDGLGMIALNRQSYADAEMYFKKAIGEGSTLGMKSAVLDALLHLASQIIAQTDPETALTWLTLVIHHSASDAFQKQTAQQVIEKIGPHLPAERVEAAQERGRMLSLDEIVAQILSDKSL